MQFPVTGKNSVTVPSDPRLKEADVDRKMVGRKRCLQWSQDGQVLIIGLFCLDSASMEYFRDSDRYGLSPGGP